MPSGFRNPAASGQAPGSSNVHKVAIAAWQERGRGHMANLVKGLHHITLCASGAQEDIDFLTKVMGQRLIKQTVLFDGRYAHYHLYYANANAEVGSVMTTFPYKRVPGRQGSGDRKSTRLNSSHSQISYAVFCLKK